MFGDASHDIHNTKNGELPGHVRYGEDSVPTKTHPAGDTKVQVEENNEKAMEDMSKDAALK